MAKRAPAKALSFSLLAPESSWVAPDELPSLRGVPRISLDVETCDPNLRELGPGTVRGDAYICGMSLGTDDGRRWYLPMRHQGGGNLDEGMVLRWARDELNGFEGDVVGAKLIYDMDHLWSVGVRMPMVRRFKDVQIAEVLLNEHRFEYNLDALSKDYLGEGKDETLLREAARALGLGDSDDSVKANIWRLPAAYVGPYGEADADRPLRIVDLQAAKLEAEGLTDLFDLECRLSPILLAMRRRGVRVDVSGVERVRDKLGRERDAIVAKVRRMAGPKAELMAPESLAQAFLDRGLPLARTAKSGQWSVTKDWLKANEGDELVDLVQAGRKVNTVVTTFLDGHFSKTVNGRIHCEFLQLRDEDGGTGARLASRNPNMLNIPSRDEELAPLVRGLCLPEEGEDWERHDQCLTGGTVVTTIDGPMTIRDLVASPVPVLSSSDCRTVEFRNVVAARSTGLRDVYEVRLEDGSCVRCTDNHRWMGFDNEELFTQDLKPGARLAHVHTGVGGRGDTPYWYVRSNRQYVYKHRLVAEFAYGPCPNGHEVDHKDTEHAHWWRSNLRYRTVTANRGEAAAIWWNRATPEQRETKTESLRQGRKKIDQHGERNPNYGKKHPGVGGRPRLGADVPCEACGGSFYRKRNTARRFCSFACKVKASRRGYGANHRVVSVTLCGQEEVFDITVDGTHTFVLENGLVSHNSQMEYRLNVHFARGRGSDEARAMYRDEPKTDFHKMCADMLGVDPEDKLLRKRVKNMNFAKSYGALAPKLARTFGISVDEAKKFVALYEAKLPFTKTTFEAAQKVAGERGYVRSILGRYGRFPLWEPADNAYKKRADRDPPLPHDRALQAYGDRIIRANTYKALNNVLQYSNADYTKKAMVDIWEAGLCAPYALGPFLLQVYDELDYSVPRTDVGDEAVREAKRLMETAIELRVPVMVEAERGKDWGECA